MSSKTKTVFIIVIIAQAFFIAVFLAFALYQKSEADKAYMEAMRQTRIANENEIRAIQERKMQLELRQKYDSLQRSESRALTPEPNQKSN